VDAIREFEANKTRPNYRALEEALQCRTISFNRKRGNEVATLQVSDL
jgi:hypothetical protein